MRLSAEHLHEPRRTKAGCCSLLLSERRSDCTHAPTVATEAKSVLLWKHALTASICLAMLSYFFRT
jgi:hypothetical protein